MNKLILAFTLLLGCAEKEYQALDLQANLDFSIQKRDFAVVEDLSEPIKDLATNQDLTAPYEILCPIFLECCSIPFLLEEAKKTVCLFFPHTPRIDYLGQACPAGYHSIFVWCD